MSQDSIPNTSNAAGLKAVAVVFPGQGSQFPGMAADIVEEFPVAREVVRAADEILGYSLSEVMAGERGADLNRTVHTQPAVFVHSMALWEVIRQLCPLEPLMAAGHSLGEYSALCAAGVLGFADALRIVRVRARAMDESQPAGSCGMAALLGLGKEEALEVVDSCRQGDTLQAANFNAPDQVVVSGHTAALERVAEALKGKRRAKLVQLPVSSAFHTSLMAPAAEALGDSLAPVVTGDFGFPVLSNVTAEPHPVEAAAVKRLLVEQVVSPVRWEDTVRNMIASGVETFVEVGPGKVLTGLVKRIDRTVATVTVSDPEGARALGRMFA